MSLPDEELETEHAVLPPHATFRRAEGLRFVATPCAGFDDIEVHAPRAGGGTRALISLEEAALLCRLDRWQTADEAGVPHEQLAEFVEADCVFFSAGRPRRDLTHAGPVPRTGRVALRRNVTFTPLVNVPEEDAPVEIPFMPRRGELEGAALVGFEFAVMEMELDTYVASLACCARHGRVLRDLLPRLDGRHEMQSLCSDPEVRPLLEALASFGLLEAHTTPDAPATDAQVTWLCHAAVLYEAGGQRILVDPLEYPCSLPARHPVLPPDWRAVGPVDAILVTHGDNDHLNPRTLCRFDRRTPVYVPVASSEQPYQVDMDAQLALLGFEQVHHVRPGDRVALGPVTVVVAPFHGEDWGLTLASVTYLLAHPTLTVFLNADSIPVPEVEHALAEEFAIDLACVGVTGAAEAHAMPPRYGYGHFYEPWIPPARRNEWVELCSGPEESAETARRLRARYVFGYAAGGAPFAAQAYIDRGTHAQLAALLDRPGDPTPLALPLGTAFSLPR
jgi:L-ascorbate metabolism protein UlaG (beta-lactamase superfamily)